MNKSMRFFALVFTGLVCLSTTLSVSASTAAQRLVEVDTTAELHAALANARPGDYISMADGIYAGGFETTISGTAELPIVLYGSRQAILEGPSVNSDYGFHLKANYWILTGFTIRNVGKGVVTDNANHNLIQGLEIYQIGMEGVHFRTFSSDNTVQYCWIHDLGLVKALAGEGVYLGSSVTNWDLYTNGQADTSNRNQVLSNLIGPNVTAEAVDIKEGTIDGLVRNNIFISTGPGVADAFVDVKGNNNRIVQNIGMYTPNSSIENAVDLVVIIPGWAQNNHIQDNRMVSSEETGILP